MCAAGEASTALPAQRYLLVLTRCCACAASPLHLPQLIGPMQHYLWILKTTHSCAPADHLLSMM